MQAISDCDFADMTRKFTVFQTGLEVTYPNYFIERNKVVEIQI